MARAAAALASVALTVASAAGPAAEPSQSVPYFGTAYYVIEAENFTASGGGGWAPKTWGKDPNYFASTNYNTFMSRRAYLHGPASATSGNATATVNIAGAGAYAVLVRYEGLATHDAAFRISIEQAGQVKYERVYGRLTNWKMWSFTGSRLAGAVNRGGLNGTVCGAEGPYALAQACMWNCKQAQTSLIPSLLPAVSAILLRRWREREHALRGDGQQHRRPPAGAAGRRARDDHGLDGRRVFRRQPAAPRRPQPRPGHADIQPDGLA
jgi:hypothetical protein